MDERMMEEEYMFREEETRAILVKVRRYMAGEIEGEEMKFLKESQDAFEKAAYEKLGQEKFNPRLDDYKLCVYIAMMEKMAQQYRSNGNRFVVTDEIEAVQLLSLMELARTLSMMTMPEEKHNKITGMMANNAEATTMQMEVNLS